MLSEEEDNIVDREENQVIDPIVIKSGLMVHSPDRKTHNQPIESPEVIISLKDSIKLIKDKYNAYTGTSSDFIDKNLPKILLT